MDGDFLDPNVAQPEPQPSRGLGRTVSFVVAGVLLFAVSAPLKTSPYQIGRSLGSLTVGLLLAVGVRRLYPKRAGKHSSLWSPSVLWLALLFVLIARLGSLGVGEQTATSPSPSASERAETQVAPSADSLLVPLDGYRYPRIPGDAEEQLFEEMVASEPDFAAVYQEGAARRIVRNGRAVAAALVFTVLADAAQSRDSRAGVLSGMKEAGSQHRQRLDFPLEAYGWRSPQGPLIVFFGDDHVATVVGKTRE